MGFFFFKPKKGIQMLKLPIKYTSLFDEDEGEKTITCYFNLSKVELLEMNVGGFAAIMQRIVDAGDAAALIREFKSLILMSYGIRDGDSFVKTDAAREEFQRHPAFEVLFMRLATDEDFASKFVVGIVPKDMAAEYTSHANKVISDAGKAKDSFEAPQLGDQA
jgi:hypothetical protein